MAKKPKKKSVDRENLSPLVKLKLNQRIKDTEQLLSGEALIAFRNLPPSGKREVVKEILRNTVAEAIDAEIIDLRSLLPLDLETIVTSVKKTGQSRSKSKVFTNYRSSTGRAVVSFEFLGNQESTSDQPHRCATPDK